MRSDDYQFSTLFLRNLKNRFVRMTNLDLNFYLDFGGLGVSKFIKVLTYQRMTSDANRDFGAVTARTARSEGMEGHARSGDDRLFKYFPGEEFDLGIR